MSFKVSGVCMSTLRLTCVVVLCALLFSGCVSVGEDFSAAEVDNIKKGETTQADIRSMFGPPWRTGNENGASTWTYGNYKYALFRPKQAKDLVIKFDDHKVVSSFTFSTTEHNE